MASIGDTQMRKQLRACRRRQRRYLRLKGGSKSSNKRNSFNVKNFDSNSEEVYVVESIRDERVIKGQKYYKVRWQGFPPEADSWEPEQNLTNVLNIISEFSSNLNNKTSDNLDVHKDCQSVCENCPASVPTPPATPSLVLQNLHDRLRGSSEERQLNNSVKRKHCTKSRTSGRYEYVPKHQLVASKTKYFDDIRDGKIDLCSNDLYSRVKTRKRCAAESASNSVSNESTQSRNGSLQGETELECDASMEHFSACSPKREPVSPSFSCLSTNESCQDFNCSFSGDGQRQSVFPLGGSELYHTETTGNVATTNVSPSHQPDIISRFNNKAVQSESYSNSSSKGISCNLCLCNAMSKVDVGLSPICSHVEPGTTALNLIMKLLNAHLSVQQSPKINYRQINKSYLALAELQDKLRSVDSQFPPVPTPSSPNGLNVPSLPESHIFNALISSSVGNHCSSSQLNNVDCNISLSGNTLPSVYSLRRLHELIAAHHARLSMNVTNLVRTWLTRADLVQVGLVSPCQWISVRQCSASLKFSWPNELCNSKSQPNRVVAPILILVHGRIAPPACYDVWMDDDGPCVIERVCLDQTYTQRALNRMLFVTTLYPLDWNSSKPQEHEVVIDFKSDSISYIHSTRPTCVAIMIVAVTLSQSNDKEKVSQQSGNLNNNQSSRSSIDNNQLT
ncbi:unnamed protein product [Schistosoma turkestanicum]|nr:unnamed protein product [Schistosoma turkestanicum]